ncbi:hypothetical protein [Streptomyces lydicus]|uniref:hypothetical protein n=1 Tax=Streptomyces lydicus TaxID=47763 RepID=UPI0033221379
MSTTVWIHEPGRKSGKAERPKDGRVWREIRVAGPGGREGGGSEETTLGYLERDLPSGGPEAYLAARKEGARTFLLWADAYRQHLLARVVTRSATKGGTAVFEVLGARGETLAVVSRNPALHGGHGRSRWTVEQAGRPAAVGVKGHLFWWWVWWLLLPLWVAIAIGSFVAGGDIARMPRSIRWKTSQEEVLVWHSGTDDFALTALADWWDPRVTAALAALVKSYDGWLGTPWDEGK